MKILVDALASRAGGTISYVGNELEALKHTHPGWSIHVLAAPWNASLLQEYGLPTTTVRLTSLPERLLYEQLLLSRKAPPYDVLYCPANFAPVLRKSRMTPIVLTVHNHNYFGEPRRHKTNRTLRRRAERVLCLKSIAASNHVVVVSEYLRRAMAADGLSGPEFSVIPPGQPTWESVRPQPPTGLEKCARFVLALANDYPHKRLQDTVAAWRLATELSPAIPPLLVAGYVTRRRRRQLRSMLPVDARPNLTFAGQVRRRSQIRWLLEHASTLVSTSELEAAPLAPLEAASVGCPLVLTDIPAHLDVAGKETLYAPVGDVQGIAQSIKKACNRKTRAWKSGPTWADHARQLGEIFDRVTSSR